jgi:hypothetical protein
MPGASCPRACRSGTGSALADLPQEQGDAEALAGRLAGEQGDQPLRQLAPVAGVLGVEMRRQAGGQDERVLAVFGAQGIDGFVEVGQSLHADDFSEQIQLPVIGFGEMMQDNAGSVIVRAGDKQGVKGRANGAEEVIGETGRKSSTRCAASL